MRGAHSRKSERKSFGLCLGPFSIWKSECGHNIYLTVAIKKRLKCFMAEHCVTFFRSLSCRAKFSILLLFSLCVCFFGHSLIFLRLFPCYYGNRYRIKWELARTVCMCVWYRWRQSTATAPQWRQNCRSKTFKQLINDYYDYMSAVWHKRKAISATRTLCTRIIFSFLGHRIPQCFFFSRSAPIY